MTQQKILLNFIDNIEKERVRLNLTQAQMAQKLDMSVSNYKKLIAGHSIGVRTFFWLSACMN